jgi:hypothetical protein
MWIQLHSCQALGGRLMRLQHLQYWKTDGMVYISDFQGMQHGLRLLSGLARRLNTLTGAGHLLIDPQVMTNPYVLRLRLIFASR